jgi:hypothetical protein
MESHPSGSHNQYATSGVPPGGRDTGLLPLFGFLVFEVGEMGADILD